MAMSDNDSDDLQFVDSLDVDAPDEETSMSTTVATASGTKRSASAVMSTAVEGCQTAQGAVTNTQQASDNSEQKDSIRPDELPVIDNPLVEYSNHTAMTTDNQTSQPSRR